MSNQFGGFISTSPLSSIPHNTLHSLLSNIIRSHFGPTIQTIFDALLGLGPLTTLPQLVNKIQSQCKRDLNDERMRLTGGKMNKMSGVETRGYVVDKNTIVAGLVTLIQHSIVTCERMVVGSNIVWKYSVDAERGKLLIRYSRYVEFAKKSVDDMAGVVVEQLLVHGRLETARVVELAVASQVELMESSGGGGGGGEDDDDEDEDEGLSEAELEELRESAVMSFRKLVESGFVQKVHPVEEDDDETNPTTITTTTTTTTDDNNTTTANDDTNDTNDTNSKKRKRDDTTTTTTTTTPSSTHPTILTLLQKSTRLTPLQTVWRTNISMFHATIRAFYLGRLVHERYGDKIPAAGSIITAALKFAAREEHAPTLYTLSAAEKMRREENRGMMTPDDVLDYLSPNVRHAMKSQTGGARAHISQALVSLSRLTWPGVVMEVEEASGHPQGGKFEVAVRQLTQHLRHRILHRVLVDQFGSTAARVCSVLGVKGYLEADAIADGVMVPAKDVREILHRLWRKDYVVLMNMQQSKSHNAGTAIYLWTVKPERMFKRVGDDVCKALLNLRLRRQHEVEVGKEWIERGKQGVADENESEVDKINYKKFCQGLERLDNACLQLDETLMLLNDF